MKTLELSSYLEVLIIPFNPFISNIHMGSFFLNKPKESYTENTTTNNNNNNNNKKQDSKIVYKKSQKNH